MPRKKQQLKDSLKSKDRCMTVSDVLLQCIFDCLDPCMCFIRSQYQYQVNVNVNLEFI